MWAAAEVRTFASRSTLHPHPPWSQPSVSPAACWYFGRLAPGTGKGTGSSVNPHCPSPRLFPCSFSAIFLAVFAICATANGARLPAQTQIPPHLSPFASTMTQQLLQGFSASPRLHPIPSCLPHHRPPPHPPLLPRCYTTLIRQSRFFFSLSLIQKPSKILRHPSEAQIHSG